MFTDLSVGAVGAAFIAAVVSLLGLIVAKEQKISEFRQAWIDSLRREVTDYLTSINAISDSLGVKYTNQTEKVKELSALYAGLNQAHFMIALRLNPDENNSAEMLSCMKKFTELALDDTGMRSQERKLIEERFLLSSKKVLKAEWRRVKHGEPTFMIAKYIMIAILFTAVILAIMQYSQRPAVEGQATPAAVSSASKIAETD